MRLRAPDGAWLLTLQTADARVREIRVLVGVEGVDVDDDNVDVELELVGGSTVSRTFITPKHIATLLARWRLTGESGGGAFLSMTDTVVVPDLSEPAIRRAVSALVDHGL